MRFSSFKFPYPLFNLLFLTPNPTFLTLLAIPLFSASMDKQKVMGVISTVVGTFILVI